MISRNQNRQLSRLLNPTLLYLVLSSSLVLSGCDHIENDTVVNALNFFDDAPTDTEASKSEDGLDIDNEEPIKAEKTPAKELALAGCYSVVENSKPQLKITEEKGSANKNSEKLSLQTKEPRSYKRAWDDPDNLDFVNLEEAHLYFDVNVPYIDMMVARDDRLFVLAHVDSSKMSMDELNNSDGITNSEYLVYLSDGSDGVEQSLEDSSDNISENGMSKETSATKRNAIKNNAVIKHIPIQPNASVIYRVECDGKK